MEAISKAEQMMREELSRALEMVVVPSAAEREMRPLPAPPPARIRLGRIFSSGRRETLGKKSCWRWLRVRG